MKIQAYTACVVTAGILSGCFCTAVPKQRSLGHLDLTQNAATFQATFVAPKGGGGSFVLCFPEGKVKSGQFCSRPTWPLEISLKITKPNDPSFVLAKDFGTNDFQFTSWHSPATSILFNWDLWPPGIFREGKEYELLLTVKKTVSELGKAEIFLHWVEE